VVPHSDADGLAAGALLQRRTRGEVLHLGSPWEEPLPSGTATVIADWGVRPVDGPSEVLYVDHHADPEAVQGTVVAPEGDAGETSTSLVAWDLLGRPPEGAWLAALGAAGDLGEGALRRGGAAAVARSADSAISPGRMKRLAALVTAPSRLRGASVSAAFDLLARSSGDADALADPGSAPLAEMLETVKAARARAIRVAPRAGTEAALIRLDEPARVHGQVAAAWSRRLAPLVVVCANHGWREGRVSFAVRSADGRDLREWLLSRYRPPGGAGDYARGHARATGGSLVPAAFEDFERAVLA
jgi:single-stranded-DNA-specific exonuclease